MSGLTAAGAGDPPNGPWHPPLQFWRQDYPTQSTIMAASLVVRLASTGKSLDLAGLYSARKAIGHRGPWHRKGPDPLHNRHVRVTSPASLTVAAEITDRGGFANTQTSFNGVTTGHTQAGWTAGAGVEWGFAENWSAKVEYLYVNLGNGTVTCMLTPQCTSFLATGIRPASG